jgi:hypothetical protein
VHDCRISIRLITKLSLGRNVSIAAELDWMVPKVSVFILLSLLHRTSQFPHKKASFVYRFWLVRIGSELKQNFKTRVGKGTDIFLKNWSSIDF